MRLILRWLISAAAVWAAAYAVPGIRVEGGFTDYLVVALVIGLVNALVRPIVSWLACGLIVLTLGLFLLVINAVLLLLAAWIAQQAGAAFFVDGFMPALYGSIVISVVSFVLSMLLPDGDGD
jgi:putative membrane protein